MLRQNLCQFQRRRRISADSDRRPQYLVPLIRGDRCALGNEAQARVATWCAMATMTAEFIDPDPNTVGVPQNDRDWLQKEGTAPAGWRMWIGHYRRHRWPAQWIHFTLPILAAGDIPKEPLPEFDPPNTQVTTFVVGQLYVHTMSSVDSANIDKWATTLHHAFPFMVPLLPHRESFIAWPPTTMSDRDADLIASAFHRYIDRISRSMLGVRLF